MYIYTYIYIYIYIHLFCYDTLIHLFVDHLNVYIDFLFQRKILRKINLKFMNKSSFGNESLPRAINRVFIFG